MAVTILGQHKVVRFCNLRVWPERGQIHIEDTRTGDFRIVRRSQMMERLQALNAACQARVRNGVHLDLAKRDQDFIMAMVEVMRTAKEQGSPHSKEARAEMRRRQPQSVSVLQMPVGVHELPDGMTIADLVDKPSISGNGASEEKASPEEG